MVTGPVLAWPTLGLFVSAALVASPPLFDVFPLDRRAGYPAGSPWHSESEDLTLKT